MNRWKNNKEWINEKIITDELTEFCVPLRSSKMRFFREDAKDEYFS